MKLLNGYILIQVDEVRSETKSGILLSEGTQKLPNSGVVKEVSPSVKAVKPGDHVAFLRYAAIDGPEDNLRLAKEEHIIGIYES